MRKYIDIINEVHLDELAGIKNNADLAGFKQAFDHGYYHGRGLRLEAFAQYLQTKGYTPLGSGQYGVAFTHPDLDYVVKLLGDDDNYLRFVGMCMSNTNNPHLPRFRGKIIRLDDRYSIVRVEKLRMAEPGSVLADMTEIIDQYCNCIVHDGGDTESYMQEVHDSGMYSEEAWERLANEPSLFQTIDSIVAIFGHADLDLHPENQMLRGETLVFIDPVTTPPRKS